MARHGRGRASGESLDGEGRDDSEERGLPRARFHAMVRGRRRRGPDESLVAHEGLALHGRGRASGESLDDDGSDYGESRGPRRAGVAARGRRRRGPGESLVAQEGLALHGRGRASGESLDDDGSDYGESRRPRRAGVAARGGRRRDPDESLDAAGIVRSQPRRGRSSTVARPEGEVEDLLQVPLQAQVQELHPQGRRWYREKASPGNIAAKIQHRELGLGRLAGTGGQRMLNEKFRNLHLQEEFNNWKFVHLNVQARSVRTLFQEKDILLAAVDSGLCIAFDRSTNSRLCVLNRQIDEKIKRILWNNIHNSLIIVSEYTKSKATDIRCSLIDLQDVKANHPFCRHRIFRKAHLRDAASVEVYPREARALLVSSNESMEVVQIFSLQNYNLLRSIPMTETTSYGSSHGLLVLHHGGSRQWYNGVEIFCTKTGDLIKTYSLPWSPNDTKNIHVLGDKLIIQQDDKTLKLVDLKRNPDEKNITIIGPPNSSDVELLVKLNLLVIRRGNEFSFFSLKGDLVNQLYLSPLHVDQYVISEDSNVLISYSTSKAQNEGSASGAITITHILKSETIAEIAGQEMEVRKSGLPHRTTIRNTASQALSRVTAIIFSEETMEILTGNEDGFVHVWSCS